MYKDRESATPFFVLTENSASNMFVFFSRPSLIRSKGKKSIDVIFVESCCVVDAFYKP